MEGYCDKKPLIIITGPTAVGKTALSVKLAKRIHGEIISADSMQVYKGMDIGTAKIHSSEMDGVKHHMIDIIEPYDEFNVSIFKRLSDRCIEEIYNRGNIPVIAGGTGFYIQAVLKNINFTEHTEDKKLRDELNEYANRNGAAALNERLCGLDKKSAKSIHPNNVKRTIRALEYCIQTGEKFSEYNERESKKESPYNFSYFVLNIDRNILYQRIEERIETMLNDGLVDEVNGLMEKGMNSDMVSMQGLGYKEIIEYLQNQCTYDEAVEKLKKETRHFAKRQLTWFRREKEVIWVDKTNRTDDEVLSMMCEHLDERGIKYDYE